MKKPRGIKSCARTKIKTNHSKRVRRFGEHIEVTLPNGEVTIIDYESEWILDKFPSWQKTRNHVTVTRVFPTEYGTATETYYLSRLIVRPPANLFVDHKNRDAMDNRRSNLRLATGAQNSANAKKTHSKSGFRGVTLTSRGLKKPYVSHIAGKNIGYYSDPIEAAKSYDLAAKEKYGDYAILNFPDNQ